jgi:hypothetical protein
MNYVIDLFAEQGHLFVRYGNAGFNDARRTRHGAASNVLAVPLARRPRSRPIFGKWTDSNAKAFGSAARSAPSVNDQKV